MITRVIRRMGDVRRLGLRRGALLIEAVFMLTWARLLTLALPFPRIAPYLGSPASPGRHSGAAVPEADRQRVRELAWAIQAAGKRLPIDAACLQRALAGRAMLRRRGIHGVVHLGIARGLEGVALADSAKTLAHAWLEAGGLKVTGYPLDPDLIEVAAFA